MSGQLPYDPAAEGAETSFEARMAYGDYLHLDEILGAQKPLTRAHDEMLFIVQHQVSELWMRLAIHEIDAARRAVAGDAVQSAFKMLSRVARIFEQLNNAWDVLRTMTPSEYTRFRGELGQSSGLQSWQYRQIEFMVGNRNRAMLRPHVHQPDILALLEGELLRPSLYDEALRFLSRNGVAVPRASLERDLSSAYEMSDGSLLRGASSTKPRKPIGLSTNSLRNWSISRTISAAGDSITSQPSSASSASSAARAAPAGSAISNACSKSSFSQSCGG